MELQKIHKDTDFSNAEIPEGQILTYIGTDENGKVVTRYKDNQGNTGTMAGGSGGAGGGGTDTSDATVTAEKLLEGVTAYGTDGKVTGTIPTVTATLNNNVTTVPKGYIAEVQTLTVSEALAPTTSGNVVTINKGYQASQKKITVGTSKSASTITPTTSDIIISKGTYLSGAQTIKGDANLIADNIKEGVSIFGVSGTLSSEPAETVSYVVSGGGSIEYNGVYVDRKVEVAGKPSYVNDNGKYLCYTEDYGWIIGDHLNSDEPMHYYNESSDITSGYRVEMGEGPSPVVAIYDPYANLLAENIKSGVVISNVTGTFTSDADASATDIAAGKTAYVKGKKITGTAAGGGAGFIPLYQYINQRLVPGMAPPVNAMQNPSNKAQNWIVYNNKLFFQEADTTSIAQLYPEVSWTFARTRPHPDEKSCIAIGDGKVYIITYDNSAFNCRCITPSLSNVTQVMDAYDNRYFFLAGDTMYVSFAEQDKYNSIDGISVRKIVNMRSSGWEPSADVITTDGSLAQVYYYYDSDVDGKPTGGYYISSQANGDPFLTAYFAMSDEFTGMMGGGGYVLAIRSSGLYYATPGGAWTKVESIPQLKSNTLVGYCATYADDNSYYDEEKGEFIERYIPYQSAVSLHIDTEGRAWKIWADCTNNGVLAGVKFAQLDDSNDWQYVPHFVEASKKYWAQKGGKLLKMKTSSVTDSTTQSRTIGITWEEFDLNPAGYLIGAFDNNLFFATHEVDITMSGGFYTV